MSEAPFLRKWYALGAANHDPKLGSPEKRIFWWFCEHANDAFETWPGTRRLGQVAGIDHRNVSRAIRKLVDTGYLTQIFPGTRHGASARYRLTLKGSADVRAWKQHGNRNPGGAVRLDDTPVVSMDDTLGVVAADDTVSSSTTQGVVSGDAKVSSPETTKPPNEPAHKAGEMGDGAIGTAPAGAALGAEREALFQQFKYQYPKPVGMADARPVFNALLDEGVPAAQLISQARALRLLIEAGRMEVKHAKQPAVWLRSRTWVDDDYTVHEYATSKAKSKAMHERTARKVTASGAQPVKAAGKVEEAKQAQPHVAAILSNDDERDRQSRRYAPVGFDVVRAKLESVNPEQQFGSTLRDALLAALKYKPELAWCEGGLDMNADEVKKEVDKALEQALSGEWGDELGYDDEGDWMTSVQWFCSEDRCRVMVDAIDQFAADCRTREA